ncbi:MAG: hypothetical protein O2985_17095, partial [Proteobacteria bacterium]|nr:hypothetical protein [Pseudomonadota bacterium]
HGIASGKLLRRQLVGFCSAVDTRTVAPSIRLLPCHSSLLSLAPMCCVLLVYQARSVRPDG